MDKVLARWQERVRAAAASGDRLCLRGGGSKDFYGGLPVGELFDCREYAGIVSYEPTELVITARAGTPLAEVEAALAERGQFLAFEPPAFASEATVDGGDLGHATLGGGDLRHATIGGVVAAGLSGPRRQQAGAVRDFVLGARLLDGRGEVLRFGGEVMKNVAGYDVSRLLAGSLGTLGLIVEVSLKVLPKPAAELTLAFELAQGPALERLNRWGGQPLPISASCWVGERLCVRLSGAVAAVAAAAAKLGGERQADDLWLALREQAHPFFAGRPLWRLSLPTTAPVLDLPLPVLVEWGGGQRWYAGEAEPQRLRALAQQAGGHATLFRAGEAARRGGVFTPLPAPLLAIHRRLKQAFDPRGVFNPGRLYPEL